MCVCVCVFPKACALLLAWESSLIGLSKEHIACFPSYSLSSRPPTSQSSGCHSAQLTAVSTRRQSIHRFKLPLPLSKRPLNLIPHLSLLFLSSSSFLLLFLSLLHAPSFLSHQHPPPPLLSSPSLFSNDLYVIHLFLFLWLDITLVTIMMRLFLVILPLFLFFYVKNSFF